MSEVVIVIEKERTVGPNVPIFVVTVGGKQEADVLTVVASNWSSHVSPGVWMIAATRLMFYCTLTTLLP